MSNTELASNANYVLAAFTSPDLYEDQSYLLKIRDALHVNGGLSFLSILVLISLFHSPLYFLFLRLVHTDV